MIDRDDQLVETDDFQDGIVVQKRNISSVFTLSESSVNVSFGRWNGPGPRYGFAPLPYQTNLETVSNALEGHSIRTSEVAASGTYPALTNRLKHLGIFSITTRINNGDDTPSEQKAFVIVSQDSSNKIHLGIPSSRTTDAISGTTERYDGIIISYNVAGPGYTIPPGLGGNFTRQEPAATLSFGLDNQSDQLPDDVDFSSGMPRLSSLWRVDDNTSFLDLAGVRKYARTSFLSITGRVFRINSLFAFTAGNSASSGTALGDLTLCITGAPNDYFYGEQEDSREPLTLYGMQDQSPDWELGVKYDFASGITTVDRQVVRDFCWNEDHYSTATSPSVSVYGTLLAGDTVDAVYIADTQMKHKSDYKFFGIAADSKAIMAIWRDDHQSLSIKSPASPFSSAIYPDNKIEFIDCNNLSYFKPVKETSGYTEDGKTTSTVWDGWPAFTTNTASTPAPTQIVEGAAGSGLLRASTTYEFTYSLVDKTLNYETNVGVPAKYRTGTNDNVALYFQRYQTYSGRTTTNSRGQVFEPSAFNCPTLQNINFKKYRIYYRELGTFEWLPAAEVDATDALVYPLDADIELCTTPIAALPGGQPGGFIDYSPLPEDNYIDTLSFQNRAFWMSRKSLHFSLRNNPLAYPVRNAVPCPKGEFVGMISHAYPGEAEQSSRLVIASTEELIVGRFVTGAEVQQTVRLGPDTTATYPVDGSNFIVDSWTSNTAYSGRSMVVAEGVLYYWGPQGVYEDGGVQLPRKISTVLEPWIENLIDENDRKNVHAVYNSETSEVIWFFQPQAVDGAEQASQALVFNTDKRVWSYWTFSGIVIDNVESVKDAIFQSDNDALSGTRIVVSIREPDGTVSRPAFFDEVVYGQDMQTNTLYMVKEVTAPTASTRRLVFADGPSSIASKTGTALVIGFQKYTGETDDPDGIYTIQSSDSTSITVNSTEFTVQTYNSDKYFPVWISSEHGFTFTMDSNYWAPRGMASWNMWKYCHTSQRVELLSDETGTAYDMTVKYYSLPGTDNSTTTITLSDNSRGNCQIFNSIPYTKDNASGQALRVQYSYTHPGGSWAFQYLGVWISPKPAGNLRIWEG